LSITTPTLIHSVKTYENALDGTCRDVSSLLVLLVGFLAPG